MAQKTAGAILDQVKEVLEGREKNYDNPKPNFDRIAAYWSVRLKEKLLPDQIVTAQDVADLMILMKVAREQYKHGEDNYLDIIGYGVCGLRVAEQEEGNPTPKYSEWYKQGWDAACEYVNPSVLSEDVIENHFLTVVNRGILVKEPFAKDEFFRGFHASSRPQGKIEL